MAITIAAGTLPDVPTDVLAEYPYCVIRANADGLTYNLLAGKHRWFITNNTIYINDNVDNGTGSYEPYVQYDATLNAENWTYKASYSDNGDYNLGNGILWANHDVCKAADTVYFPKSEESTSGGYTPPEVEEGARYSASAEWWLDLADEVRRLTETTDKKDHETMLSDLQGLELSGGGGDYPGGDTETYPDAENVDFGTTSAGSELYTGKYFYGTYPDALTLPNLINGYEYIVLVHGAYRDTDYGTWLIASDTPMMHQLTTYGRVTIPTNNYQTYSLDTDSLEFTLKEENLNTGAYPCVERVRYYWTSLDILTQSSTSVKCAGSTPIPETTESVEYIETAETYTISGVTLTALGAVTQQITGIAATTPSAMVSALQMYAGTH